MASLGNLYFDIKFKDDPKELEEFKKRVLAQLAEVEVSVGVVPSKDELTKTINQVLNEKYKLNLTVDKQEVGEAINNAVNKSTSTQGVQQQMGYIDALVAKLNELEAKYRDLPKGADASGLITQFRTFQTELDKVGRNLSSAFLKSFSDINAMSEKTIGEIQQKIKFLEQYKITIPIDNESGIKSVDNIINRLKSTLDAIKNEPVDPFKLAENTLDNIKTKISAFTELKGKSVINSDEYNKASVELERLKALQKDVLNPPPPAKTFAEVMGMDSRSLNEIKSKISEIRKLRDNINLSTPSGMSTATELNKEEAALLRVQKEHLNNIKINSLAEGSVVQLRAQVSNLIVAYDNLSGAERNASQGEELLSKLRKTTIELKEAEEASLRYQRNVGNYKSGWNGLQFQVQQLARELPSIAYGANIFFAAISNNLPMFTDELKKAGVEYKKLRAEQAQGLNLNQKAIPVWKQLIGSIFSWQTAIVAVVTILTLYGAKMIDSISKMLKFKDSVDLTRKEIEKLNNTFADAAGKEISKLDSLFDKLNKAKEGTNKWNKAKSDIINQYGDYLSGMDDEITSLNNQTEAYKILTDAIYQKIKAQTRDTLVGEYATDRAKKTMDEYGNIQKIIEKVYGRIEDGTKGASLFHEIQSQLEETGKLSDDLISKIREDFGSGSAGMYSPTTGSTGVSVSQFDVMRKSINSITNEHEKYNNKVTETDRLLGLMYKNTKEEVTRNKSYWESERSALQKRLDGMTAEQAKGEEGLKIKNKILEIDKLITSYDTKEKNDNEKTNSVLKDRLTLLRQSYNLYKEFMSLGVGRSSSINLVNDLLGVDFNPDDYRKNIESILKQATGRKNQSIKIEASQILTGLDKETIDKSLAETEKYISDTISGWNLFDKLFEKTGDYNFSINAAFGGNVQFKSVIGQLKSDIESALSATGISFDEIIQMSPENIKAEHGAALSSLVKAYQEQNRKIKEDTVKTLADLLAETKSYEQKREDIVNKWSKITEDTLLGETERGAAKNKMDEELASLDFAQFKDTDLWAKAFEDLDRLSTGTIDDIIAKLEEFKNTAGKNLPINEFKELMNVLKKMRGESESRNPFKSLIKGFKDLKIAGKDQDKRRSAINTIIDSLSNITPYADAAGQALGGLKNMFDALGDTEMSDAMGNAQDALSSISNIGQGFAKGGIVGGIGAAIGEAANWVGKLAAAHDNILDKAIEKSIQQAERLRNTYEAIERSLKRSLGENSSILGNVDNPYLARIEEEEKRIADLERLLSQFTSKGKPEWMSISQYQSTINKYNSQLDEAKKSLEELKRLSNSFSVESNLFEYQRKLIEQEIEELKKQRDAELQKNAPDPSTLARLDAEILEAEDRLAYFAEDLASTLYGINLKDWASELGDTLYNAWKQGEDGAEAFKKKSAEIIGDVMNDMLKISILEPMMKDVREALFGKNGKSGYFGDDYALDENEMKGLASILMEGEKKSEAYYEALDGLNDYLEKNYGVSLKDKDAGGGLSAGIKGITEDTASLLASYLNATRSDVNQQLVLVRKLIDSDIPKMNVMAQAQLAQLRIIADNTGRNASAAEDIIDLLNRYTTPGKGFKIG